MLFTSIISSSCAGNWMIKVSHISPTLTSIIDDILRAMQHIRCPTSHTSQYCILLLSFSRFSFRSFAHQSLRHYSKNINHFTFNALTLPCMYIFHVTGAGKFCKVIKISIYNIIFSSSGFSSLPNKVFLLSLKKT